jgi:hypothetical protein
VTHARSSETNVPNISESEGQHVRVPTSVRRESSSSRRRQSSQAGGRRIDPDICPAQAVADRASETMAARGHPRGVALGG